MQIHSVFHVSLLEPASHETFLQIKPTLIESENQKKYKSEQILDLQNINNQPYYLIKWKKYNTSENT